MANKQSDDYEAGLTTPMVNPDTGKTIAGAAARNHRLKGHGVTGYAAQAIAEAMRPVEIMMNQLDSRLAQNNAIIASVVAENSELRDKIRTLQI